MKKDLKIQSHTFATLNSKLQDMEEEESYLSDSDESGSSFFQRHDSGPNIQHVLQNSSTPKYRGLDLTKVILLDIQSTIDLFCNPELTSKIMPSAQSSTVLGNGGTLEVHQKLTTPGYETDFWYDSKAITNILSLANMSKQYRVTYDRKDKAFIIHRHKVKLPNMVFHEHKSGLHVYKPPTKRKVKGIEQVVFINTVRENMKAFTKRKINRGRRARRLSDTLFFSQ